MDQNVNKMGTAWTGPEQSIIKKKGKIINRPETRAHLPQISLSIAINDYFIRAFNAALLK
jgi:hypothetical protein